MFRYNIFSKVSYNISKPIFAYGAGFEYNNYSTYTMFVDEPWSYTNGPSINNWNGTSTAVQDTYIISPMIAAGTKNNDNQLVIDTLNEAIAKRKDVHGLIIHSDQGFQYTSYEYKAICESNKILISMSRKGTPIDDSPMESFHAILKKETLYNNDITNLNEYIALVEDWLEFYNTKRLKNKRK